MVNRDHLACGWNECERGAPSPAADIEDAAAFRECFACALVRCRIRNIPFDGEHRYGMDPRWRGCLGQDFVGDGPGVQVFTPRGGKGLQVVVSRHTPEGI